PIHLDTPPNETDQLVADMSGFSLDPKPAKTKELAGIFSHTTPGYHKKERDIQSTDEPQVNFQTPASGPEHLLEIPHSPKRPGAPVPTKATTSSSDPLDLLYSRPPDSKRIEASHEVGNHIDPDENHAQENIKKVKRVYGKGNRQKSVAFVGSPDHKTRPKSNGEKERVKSRAKGPTCSKRRSSDDKMDTSEDELLL
ncbi:16738_t:CDS:1, partial [Acaulospora colombiana]